MGFSLTQYDHVEKFTLLQAFEYLNKNEISTDIAMLLIFEKIFDLNKGNSKLSVYGQVEGGYRYDASTYEIENILNVYRWYRNPDNPQSFSREYTFDDEDIKTLNTYFFDKKEFCNFFDLSYKSEADEKFDELMENIPKLFEQYNESLKEIEKQIEEIEKLENENFEQAEEIALLKAENEQLRAMQEVDNGGKVATLSEYEGELPPKTDADKLADFIELVFNPDLLDNGKIPTYSRLHTKLTAKYRDRKITAKNTIKKYLNQF